MRKLVMEMLAWFFNLPQWGVVAGVLLRAVMIDHDCVQGRRDMTCVVYTMHCHQVQHDGDTRYCC
jgi:hypothetical protein